MRESSSKSLTPTKNVSRSQLMLPEEPQDDESRARCKPMWIWESDGAAKRWVWYAKLIANHSFRIRCAHQRQGAYEDRQEKKLPVMSTLPIKNAKKIGLYTLALRHTSLSLANRHIPMGIVCVVPTTYSRKNKKKSAQKERFLRKI